MEEKQAVLTFKQVLILKALKDPEFKKKLLEDPKKAIQEEFQITLPEDLKINVFENQEKTVNLVIPYASGELSDEELENLAGAGALDDIGNWFKARGKDISDWATDWWKKQGTTVKPTWKL